MGVLKLGSNTISYITFSSGSSGGDVDIPRNTSQLGILEAPTQSFTFSTPSNAADLSSNCLRYSFYGSGITSLDMSSLTSITGHYACEYMCYGSNIATLNLSNVTTISGNYAFNYAFFSCGYLTSVNLNSLTTVSGQYAFQRAFEGTPITAFDVHNLTTVNATNAFSNVCNSCTEITSINFDNLESINGNSAFLNAFAIPLGNNNYVTSVTFPKLSTLKGSNALKGMLAQRSNLRTVSFPALKSTSFGSYTNQFNVMLNLIDGCTVRFPSNLQSVIGSWTDVVNGFGGTNTNVQFDLPATE